jgi:hypothetical protein
MVSFASNWLQLPVLSLWQEHAESQSRIVLSSGTNNPLVWLQLYSKRTCLLLYCAKCVTLPYRLIMLPSCGPHVTLVYCYAKMKVSSCHADYLDNNSNALFFSALSLYNAVAHV